MKPATPPTKDEIRVKKLIETVGITDTRAAEMLGIKPENLAKRMWTIHKYLLRNKRSSTKPRS
jgi:plasmid maintenance system antidote protein VapI